MGDTIARTTPTALTGTSWVEPAAGAGFSCARRSDQTLACWGTRGVGQLGINSPAETASPVAVVL